MDSRTDPFPQSRRLAVLDAAAWRAFVWRWGISLASLASGLVTLFIFRRGVPHVGWIIGYVVVLWLLFAVLGQMRGALLAGGRHLVVAAGDYTIQTLYRPPPVRPAGLLRGHDVRWHHGRLLRRLGGGRAPDHGGSLVSRRGAPAGRGSGSPSSGSRSSPGSTSRSRSSASAGAVVASAGLAALGLTPSFFARAGRWPGALARAAAVAVLAVAVAWLARPAVPPAPVSLVHPTLARAVVDLVPVEPVARVTLKELGSGAG